MIIKREGITWEAPFWDLLPQLSEQEFEALKADIKEKGQQYPILYRATNGTRRILDGWHRFKAWLQLRDEGHDAQIALRLINQDLTPQQEEDLVLSLNLKRRHLTNDQRAEWAVKLRQKGKSYRQIAEALGVSKDTIARDLSTVSNETVELPSTVVGNDGKERAATRPPLRIDGNAQRNDKHQMFDDAEAKRRESSRAGTFRADPPPAPLPQPPTPLAHEEPANETPTQAAPSSVIVDPELFEDEETMHRHSQACLTRHPDGDYLHCGYGPDSDPLALRGYREESSATTARSTEESAPPTPGDGESLSPSEECDDGNEEEETEEEAPKRYVHWNTPPEIIQLITDCLGDIDLDPCSNEHSQIKAAQRFTAADDGLNRPWEVWVPGPFGLIYVNPPYSTAGAWARKCAFVSDTCPDLDIVLLVPARSGAGWFHDWVLKKAHSICWWRGRIQFWREGQPFKGSANFDPIFAYWGPNQEAFAEFFSPKGEVHNLRELRQLREAA